MERVVVAVPFAGRLSRLLPSVASSTKVEVESVTLPLNPSTLLRLTVAVADSPGVNENEDGRIEREKSGPITFT
jgi:hypothetical protein